MIRVTLDASVLDQGIDNVNFFNGRVLTAQDLRDEQQADAEHRRRIGHALGHGVVSGLDVGVGADGRSVAVAAGLAVNPRGEIVELAAPGVEVALVVPGEESSGDARAPFAPCETAPSASVVSGDGLYLLVLAQAAGSRGRAPAVSFGAGGIAADCGARYTVEGLTFRLVGLDVQGLADRSGLDDDARAALMAAPGSESRLRTRNVLAHLLLDTALEAGADRAPLGAQPAGALDELRRAGVLTGTDVPIALLAWSDGTIEFLDGWAARRSPVPITAGPAWLGFVDARRTPLRVAALAQFQDQIAELSAGPESKSLRATRRLRFLPAAGLLPAGLDLDRFFEGVPVNGPEPLLPERLEALVRRSLVYPPIDLASGEVTRVYALDDGGAAFASSQLPRAERWRLELVTVRPVRPVAVGETVDLTGRGFVRGDAAPDVSFGGVGAEVPTVSDMALGVVVPELELPPEGAPTVVTVRRGEEEDWALIRVLPGDTVTGKLRFTRGGSLFRPRFAVVSHLNKTADISLQASVEFDGEVLEVPVRPRVLKAVAPREEREFEIATGRGFPVFAGLSRPDRVVVTARAGKITATEVLELRR